MCLPAWKKHIDAAELLAQLSNSRLLDGHLDRINASPELREEIARTIDDSRKKLQQVPTIDSNGEPDVVLVKHQIANVVGVVVVWLVGGTLIVAIWDAMDAMGADTIE